MTTFLATVFFFIASLVIASWSAHSTENSLRERFVNYAAAVVSFGLAAMFSINVLQAAGQEKGSVFLMLIACIPPAIGLYLNFLLTKTAPCPPPKK